MKIHSEKMLKNMYIIKNTYFVIASRYCLLFAFSRLEITSGWRVKSGAKNSRYSVNGSSFDICSSTNSDVSYVQHRATFLSVYPPPPTTRVGTLRFFTNFTHSPCPFVLNEKQPSLKYDYAIISMVTNIVP